MTTLDSKLTKILDKHFPDEMDSQMYHPNLPEVIASLKSLIKETAKLDEKSKDSL